MTTLASLVDAVETAGLAYRGVLALSPAERVGPLGAARAIVLVGMVGAQQWPAFAASPEAMDGVPHPLDRWSRRVVGGLADECGALALYPFEGPPYWPFQAWARRAEPLSPSPVGMLIYPRYGLWHGYRGALAFEEEIAAPEFEPSRSPCETCVEKPCLSACPVAAFKPSGYDVAACAKHASSVLGEACRVGGCLARRACPVGREYAQGEEQARFHVRAFLAARGL